MKSSSKYIGILVLGCFISFVMISFLASFQHITFFEIDPLKANINDEVMYLKQIQSVVSYGVPQGYFGYNGSTARVATFGAWSPIICFIYVPLSFLLNNSVYCMYIFNFLCYALSISICFSSISEYINLHFVVGV